MNLIKYFFVFTSFISFSQNESNQNINNTPIITINVLKSDTITHKNTTEEVVTISIKKGENQVIHDEMYYLSEIKKIDDHIMSIDTKIEWVKENEVVNYTWLMEMNKIKSELLDEKSKLLKKIN